MMEDCDFQEATESMSMDNLERPIELLSDNGVRCTADQWVAHGDWLVEEHHARRAEITTPFAVEMRAEQADACGPDGHSFAFMRGDLEDINSDGDGFGAWVESGTDVSDIVRQILAERWRGITFQLPTPAGVW
jgi:hypothetical protein